MLEVRWAVGDGFLGKGFSHQLLLTPSPDTGTCSVYTGSDQSPVGPAAPGSHSLSASLSTSKDDSGFAAPPLVSQGVAVVAVGYDIAPKGRCCPAEAAAACAAQCPPTLPFAPCLGHMDAMVLQVRRSLVFLVERYPRIRWAAAGSGVGL